MRACQHPLLHRCPGSWPCAPLLGSGSARAAAAGGGRSAPGAHVRGQCPVQSCVRAPTHLVGRQQLHKVRCRRLPRGVGVELLGPLRAPTVSGVSASPHSPALIEGPPPERPASPPPLCSKWAGPAPQSGTLGLPCRRTSGPRPAAVAWRGGACRLQPYPLQGSRLQFDGRPAGPGQCGPPKQSGQSARSMWSTLRPVAAQPIERT